MDDRDLYRQKFQAQLDGWQADVNRMRSDASGATEDAKIHMKKQLQAIEVRLEDARAKALALAEENDGAWDSLKKALSDTMAKITH